MRSCGSDRSRRSICGKHAAQPALRLDARKRQQGRARPRPAAESPQLDNPVWSCLVSAVCMDPDAQGRRDARALAGRVVNRMLRTALPPFLHLESKNTRAIEPYGTPGFVRRAAFPLLHARRHGHRRGFVPSPSSLLRSRRPGQFVRAPPRGPRSGRRWLPHPSAQRRVPGDIAPVHPRPPTGLISNYSCQVAVACEMSTTTPAAGSK